MPRRQSKKAAAGAALARGEEQVPGGDENTGLGSEVVGFAGDLQKLLDEARTKASAWLDQRKSISDQLVNIRDAAVALLRHLGAQGILRPSAAPTPRGGRRRRARGSKAAAAAPGRIRRRKRRTLSAETRRKMADAQKRRWAAVRAKAEK